LAALRDALSPTPSTILSALTTIQSTLMDDIIEAAKDDVEYQDHCNQLNSSSHDNPTFSFQHGLLVRGDAIYIPASPTLRQHIIEEFHDIPIAGHPGIGYTYNALSLHFYWPKMRTDVESYVKSCDACQRAKNS